MAERRRDSGRQYVGQHRAVRKRSYRPLAVTALAGTAVVAACVALVLKDPDSSGPAGTAQAAANSAPCESTLHVVTASSFASVLNGIAPGLETGDDCVRLRVDVADGRTAPSRVAELGAHVWIPDDGAWANAAGETALAEESIGGAGTVVATSPLYLVTDEPTATRLAEAGGGWLALADLIGTDSGVRLTVRDPAGSGDGLLGAGAVGEAVWETRGMDASAEALANALPRIRTVSAPDLALPQDAGEVGILPEYAIVPLLAQGDGDAAARLRESTMLAASDWSAVLRYTWLPTQAAVSDPALTKPMQRLLAVLNGEPADEPLAAAALRRPDAGPPRGATDALPAISATPFGMLGGHHIDHVFATWYAEDRRSDLLVAVDVSGSMGAPAPGSEAPLIDLVREGTRALGGLLPDDSELALWEFGSRLDFPRDYRTVLPRGPLDAAHRRELDGALNRLVARDTGTGLYDTILAAYTTARDGVRDGIPSHVVVFTDGLNEDDPGSISGEQLAEGLTAARDPERPVHLTVITFGPQPNAETMETLLEPVEGYVEHLERADQIRSAFIHAAAGGVHH